MSGPLRTPRGVFITGTDTGVGKTIVTAVVASAFTAHGVNAGIMKPITTGVAENSTGLSDPDWLVSAMGVTDPPDLVAPYRFPTPAAPLVAAASMGQHIDLKRILDAFQTLSTRHDCVVVEGIGGVMVPLTPDLLVVDLVQRMGLPVLVVARASLGSINHTLLTLECLRNRGVTICGLIFNHPFPSSASTDESNTVPTILQLSGLRSFGELPHCEGLPRSWQQHRGALIGRLDVEGLLEELGLRELA